MFSLGQFDTKKSFINYGIMIVGINSKKIIVLDAMRPEFRLGSLYDRRTDNLLPGFTFWKADSYKKEGFVSE